MIESSNPAHRVNPRAFLRRGFTLVEVMMAAVILTIGFGAMIQAMITGSEILANARRQTLATQLLTHEIEKLRFSDWTTINALPSGPTTIMDSANSVWPTDDNYANLTGSIAHSTFQNAITASSASYIVTRSVSTVDTELREVTFTVTWAVRSSGQNAARTYTRINSAYFAKYGLSLTYQRS
ncbi:MAG: prepilin-type N-terminal cleavage/methylation domain-containing protein [Cephaloticoccus sp.]|nr:prepilin-type N-terminal cleavage/methylation domain-containing protein [Cephaloticoccus sp.]MCF7760068.1 prepilin-type N-terminal cleavage/methylation domain-containing protein [Cephaloticoccus sp.]